MDLAPRTVRKSDVQIRDFSPPRCVFELLSAPEIATLAPDVLYGSLAAGPEPLFPMGSS